MLVNQVLIIAMIKLLFTLNTFLFVFVTQAQLLLIEKPVRFLALGDSYTIGQSVSYKERWPTQLANSLQDLGYQVDTVTFIARTGWRTDDLKNGINNVKPDSNYNLVSLLIGVNNQYQGEPMSRYLKEFPELLRQAIDFAGGIKERVFVMSIPDYMYTPTRNYFPNPDAVSRKLDEYNAIAKAYCDTFQVKYFDITPISRQGLTDTELVAGDGLHPSGKQYGAWVDLILSKGIITASHFLAEKHKNLFSPNPAVDTIVLSNEVEHWEIITQAGNVVIKGNEKSVDIKKITPGVYLFRGYSKSLNEVWTQKLLIN